jgi:hypothetical protein
MDSENSHKCSQIAESGFSCGFLERYHKDGKFLNHIILITGDETWIKAVDAHTFKQAEKV